MAGKKNDMIKVMRLLQFTDSQFPVGTFTFSNGLETASFEGIVKDASPLSYYFLFPSSFFNDGDDDVRGHDHDNELYDRDHVHENDFRDLRHQKVFLFHEEPDME